ncbi:hypothetical protein KC349_g62 [Hortaea werneckii]|nr:hypothetical protein KC349_g62 [Hortaea werneckii]
MAFSAACGSCLAALRIADLSSSSSFDAVFFCLLLFLLPFPLNTTTRRSLPPQPSFDLPFLIRIPNLLRPIRHRFQDHYAPIDIHERHTGNFPQPSTDGRSLRRDDVPVLICPAVLGIHHTKDTLAFLQRFGELMVSAAPALRRLGHLDPFLYRCRMQHWLISGLISPCRVCESMWPSRILNREASRMMALSRRTW